jgi:hypothetical protein
VPGHDDLGPAAEQQHWQALSRVHGGKAGAPPGLMCSASQNSAV